MKKAYQSPETEVVNVVMESMMAGSVGTPDAGIDPEGSVNAGSIESRRNSLWDDDEEDF